MARSADEMLDWIEERARRSVSGVSIDFRKGAGFRFMRRFHIGDARPTLRQAIEAEMDTPIARLEKEGR
jgi:hypothetical protein